MHRGQHGLLRTRYLIGFAGAFWLQCAPVSQRIHARWFGAMIADSCPPRIIHISLSGGDRKAQAKGIRYAHGIHNSYFKEWVLIRSAAEGNP
jgi:hypothetical protein